MHSDLERAFFHELGHYVARAINLKNFGVMGKVKEIALFPSHTNYDIYIGVTAPVIPDGAEENTPTIHIPERIAVLTYGCLFESVYRGEKFEDCFALGKNGSYDAKKWDDELFFIGIHDKSEINPVDDEYCQVLKDTHCLDKLFDIDVKTVLINEGYGPRGYVVDLQKLDGLLTNFLIEHEPMYLKYLERIRAIVSKKTNGGPTG